MADLIQSMNGMAIPTLIAAANLIIVAGPWLLDVAKTAFEWRQKQHEHGLKIIESETAEVPQLVKNSIKRDLVLQTIHSIKRIPVKTVEEMMAIEDLIQRHKESISELDIRRSYEQLRFNGGQVGFHLSGVVHGLLLLQSVMAAIMLAYLTISIGDTVNNYVNDRPYWGSAAVAMTIGSGLWAMVIWGPLQLSSIYRVQRFIASESVAGQISGAEVPRKQDGPLS